MLLRLLFEVKKLDIGVNKKFCRLGQSFPGRGFCNLPLCTQVQSADNRLS